MSTNAVRLHRILRSTSERVYRAFLDPDAIVKWAAPHGFVTKIDHMEPRIGGTYRMSFRNLATGHSHSFGGKFLELVPSELIRHTDVFDDPNLPGEMLLTVRIKPVSVGVELNLIQEGIPSAIPLDASYLGWQQALTLLAMLVEAEVPND